MKRKKFIKFMMGRGKSRNQAAIIADITERRPATREWYVQCEKIHSAGEKFIDRMRNLFGRFY